MTSELEDAKAIFRLILIWFTCLSYAVIFVQAFTSPRKDSDHLAQVLKHRLLHYNLSSTVQLSSSFLSMTGFWSVLPELLLRNLRV